MSVDVENAREPERLLDEVVAAYMEAREAGARTDRSAWLARYPELAEELQAFFADEDQFDSLVAPLCARKVSSGQGAVGSAEQKLASTEIIARPLDPSPATAPCPLSAAPCFFGDYELLEEIARGGMGIVYKARQISLNRPVALKMIKSGQFAYREEVQRFRLEAEAAAHLDHPHIVPIYEIGEHDGQHFFSMKLIEGGNLAQRLADFQLPIADLKTRKDVLGRNWTRSEIGNRQSAIGNLVASVARAVDYAHQRGLLHRDLKPANILVDAQGQPHITDFGLVKKVGGRAKAAGSLEEEDLLAAQGTRPLTESGLAVGTPNYMAPEQANADRKALTTAADIYGLGAILYELLTGRPPFRGETPLETLLHVLEREPDPPRALSPVVDRDLETICLKCLDKDPAKRYPSAAALAEELERFLAGEPIKARPVSSVERMRRWCRRNPALAAASTLAGVALLAVVVGSLFFAWQKAGHVEELRQERDATERARARAQAALDKVKRAQRQTRQALQKARRHADEARQAQALAEARFWRGQRAVGELCFRLGEEKLARYPGLQPVRKELLEAGLKYYQEFLKEKGHDPRVRKELAETLFRIAYITNVIDAQPKALAAYEQALSIYQDLLKKDPENVEFQAGVARTSLNIGLLQNALGEPRRALASYEKARDLYDRLRRFQPRNFQYPSGLMMSYSNLGGLYRSLGQVPRSVTAYRQALAIAEDMDRHQGGVPRYQSELAVAHANMGVMYGVLDRGADALKSYRTAWAIQKKLADNNPRDDALQRDLALSYRRIGNRLCSNNQSGEGIKWLEQGRDILKKLALTNPRVTEYVGFLAECHIEIGKAQLKRNQMAIALKCYEQALFLHKQMDRRHPRVWPIQAALAGTYRALGSAEDRRGRTAAALRFLQKARAIQEQVVLANEDNLFYRGSLGNTLDQLGRVLAQGGHPDQAVPLIRQAIEQRRFVVDRAPQLIRHVRELSYSYAFLGDLENRRGRPRMALLAWQECQRILEQFAGNNPRNEELQCDLSDNLMRMARVYQAGKELDQACACYQRARCIRSRQVNLIPAEPHIRGALGEIYYRLALVSFLKNQRQQELLYYGKARTTLEHVAKARPDLLVYRKNLCTVWNNIGATLAELDQCRAGAAAVRKALEEQRRNVKDFPQEASCKKALAGNYLALAFVLRRDQRQAEAVAASLEARQLSAGQAALLFQIACSLAKSAQRVGDGKTQRTPPQEEERQKYCALAMDVLRQALAAGYRDRTALEKNPALAGLRQRDDFKALLAGLMR